MTEGVAVPGGTCGTKPCWVDRGSKGLRYLDTSSVPTGVRKMTLKPGEAGKAKMRVGAVGLPVMAPPLPLALPSTMQLQASNGECWETTFSTAITNDAARFEATSD